jgi:hypothetical protein
MCSIQMIYVDTYNITDFDLSTLVKYRELNTSIIFLAELNTIRSIVWSRVCYGADSRDNQSVLQDVHVRSNYLI